MCDIRNGTIQTASKCGVHVKTSQKVIYPIISTCTTNRTERKLSANKDTERLINDYSVVIDARQK